MFKFLFNPRVTIWIVACGSFGCSALIGLPGIAVMVSPGSGLIGEAMVIIALVIFTSTTLFISEMWARLNKEKKEN